MEILVVMDDIWYNECVFFSLLCFNLNNYWGFLFYVQNVHLENGGGIDG